MADPIRVVVQFAHVLSAVLWIGGAAYAGLVVGRSLMGAAPQVRGGAMALIGPAGFTFLNWAGIATIVFGLWNGYLLGGPQYDMPGDTWRNLMFGGLLLGIVMIGLAHGIIRPSLRKMAEAAAGKAQHDMAALQKRLMTTSLANVALGVVAVLLMVWAVKERAG